MSVRVYDLAHSRTGDKGNTSNISVIAYDEKDWDFLRRELTEERVMDALKHIAKGPVTRYEIRNLKAFNFVVENALGGGVTDLARAGHPRQEPLQRRAGDRAAGSGLNQDGRVQFRFYPVERPAGSHILEVER